MKATLKHALLSTILLFSGLVYGAQVDTISVFSNAMHKNIKVVVITPKGYSQLSKPTPVVYLLHGYSGDYSSWIKEDPQIATLSDQYNMLIVCADSTTSSWYFDSPVDSTFKYETFMSKELVTYIDQHYNTLATRKGRAITGLSMGGHGALYLALRHQDVYGAAGSMSGGVDIRPFPLNWEIAKRLGTYAEHPENWEMNTVTNMLHLLTPHSLELIIDCGSEDFFYKVNCELHAKLLERNIPHDFITRPGSHNWDYWRNSVQYQLLFMNNYFNAK